MKKIRLSKGLSFVMAMCMLFGLNTTFLAADNSIRQTEYLEEHYQVNFKDVDYYIVDGKELIIEEEDSRSFWTRNHVQSEIDKLENAFEQTPDMEQSIINDLEEEEEMMAVSVGEAPVIFVEDHFERVATSDVGTYASNDKYAYGKCADPKEGNFFLYTNVKRVGSRNLDGTYTYVTTTKGLWSANLFTGGKKYPAAGEDYVLQTTPEGWVRKAYSMTATYDNSPKVGEGGKDYWPCDGGENYIKYAILDDPFGWRQNTSFEVTCMTNASSSTSSRMIKSYYLHTWASLSLEVSVSASTDKSVSLNLTPSIKDKSWDFYSDVTFNF